MTDVGALQRITTEYVEREDRIRLTGELTDGSAVVLWLTQRLVNRLVPHLVGWLARQVAPASAIPSVQAAHQDIVQGFAQQAALAQLAPQSPVRAPSPLADWCVDAVDIAQGEDAVVLTFQSEAQAHAMLSLAAQPLRQWLGIIFEQYLRGEWHTTVWPAWMEQAQAHHTPTTRSAVLH